MTQISRADTSSSSIGSATEHLLTTTIGVTRQRSGQHGAQLTTDSARFGTQMVLPSDPPRTTPNRVTTPQPPHDRPLTGLVGIISGAGKGLGRAFALHAAASGASIIVNNRNRVVDDDGRGPADHVVAEIR